MSRPCPTPGKHGYETKRTAKQHAIGAMRKRSLHLRVYKCPGCRMWHLTSQPMMFKSDEPRE